MDVVNCPHCGAAVKINSTSLAFPCPKCGKAFNPKYPDGAPVKGFTKHEVRDSAAKPEGKASGGKPFMKKPAVRIAGGVLAVFALFMCVLRFTQMWEIVTDSEPEGPAGWHRHRSDSAGFTAWFPAKPSAETVPGMGLLGEVQVVRCESDGTSAELFCEKLFVLMTIDFEETVRLTMEACEATLREKKSTEHQGLPAVFARGDSPKGEVRMLALEANKRTYILVIVGNGEAWDDFIDCFYLDREQRIAPQELEP